MTRRKLIAGNWKMHGSAEQVQAFGHTMAQSAFELDCDLTVCVPFVYIQQMARALGETPMMVGAQDVSAQAEAGALTGEISGEMLVDCGACYVVVGHSERRQMHGETDQTVVAKAEAAVAAGLTPIICIGETLEQREANQAEAVLKSQISALIEGCQRTTLEKMVLAYEPIWAIGTGRSATPEQAQAMHSLVRHQIAMWDENIADALLILYGGSVKPDNAATLFAEADVDGALVGGASLEAESFIEIARAIV